LPKTSFQADSTDGLGARVSLKAPEVLVVPARPCGQNAARVAGRRRQLDHPLTVKSALTSDYQLGNWLVMLADYSSCSSETSWFVRECPLQADLDLRQCQPTASLGPCLVHSRRFAARSEACVVRPKCGQSGPATTAGWLGPSVNSQLTAALLRRCSPYPACGCWAYGARGGGSLVVSSAEPAPAHVTLSPGL
jgi:hypothetical protein